MSAVGPDFFQRFDQPRQRLPRGRDVAFVAAVLLVCVLLALLLWFWYDGRLEGRSYGVPRAVTPAGDLAQDEQATIALYNLAAPSVVHITNLTVGRDLFTLDLEHVPRGTGSGFVWDEGGHIVTNYHVVQGADAAQVVLTDEKGRRTSYQTREIWAYPDMDIAVLRIRGFRSGLRPIPIGESRNLKVGQKTFAIGNPFGLDRSLTVGIVSALDREIQSVTGRPIRGVIQTSAPINPGNSGGPLLDSSGRLIGVNTAILSPSGAFAGVGFAIPVDEVNRIVPELIRRMAKSRKRQGKVVPPRLGIVPASDQLARRFGVTEGVLVRQVMPNSPASRAGLQAALVNAEGQLIRGDIIMAINDKTIGNVSDLLATLSQFQEGDTVTLTILRGEKELKVPVTLEAVDS